MMDISKQTLKQKIKKNNRNVDIMSTIAAKVKEIVVNQLGVSPDQATIEAKFIEDLGADSLDQVELIMALEEEFGADIPDEEAKKLSSVGAAIKYIEKKIQA